MLYIGLLLVLCFVCLVWWLGHKKSHLDPPEFSGRLPIIGHAHYIMGNGEQMLKGLRRIGKECTEKGGVLTVYLGFRKVYGVSDPDDSLAIMNTFLQKHVFFDFAKPLVGDGLITADVPTWKRNRKLLNPAFNQQVLDDFIEVFNTQAERLVGQFANEAGKPFDQEVLFRVNNLETICTTSLGICGTDSEYSDIFKQYLPRLSKIIQSLNERVQKFWLHTDFIYNMTPMKKKTDEDIKLTTALSQLIIQKKKNERINQQEKLSSTDSVSGKFKPFIDLILDLAAETNCFTEDHIRAETDTVMAGGHDTTATTLTFVLALLGSNINVQDKAYQEILNVLGDSDKCVHKEDLNKLVYIEAIIKETLRLYTITPVLPRYIDKDIKLKNYTLKAGSDCFILMDDIHRHPIWGPDAEHFRPERWLDKETLPDLKYYGAFGLGRRACIGKTYAMMTMKIILTHVLRKFRITSDIRNMATKMHVMLRPQSGHYITLTLRNRHEL